MEFMPRNFASLLRIAVLSISIASVIFSCKKTSSDFPKYISISTEFNLASTCSELYMTAKHDMQGKDYLYVAAKEGGLKIYDLSKNPKLKKTVSLSQLDSLEVMNLTQSGNYLFLALGNNFGTGLQNPGMAILDVSDPINPVVKSIWKDPAKITGAAIVAVDGNYAYLGAMRSGLIIFDISDKTAPVVESVFLPSTAYPDPNPDLTKFNARGMTIDEDLLYLCYDAGGLRVIDISDKQNPVEIGNYANPLMSGKPRAYNNIVIDDSLAYVAVDYCGMEVLNIKDPLNIQLVNWWNPWRCETNPLNWFVSDGHSNEIVLDKLNKMVFMSTGKSDMDVIDVHDPKHLSTRFEYGGVSNGMGTWGLSIYKDQIYLSYICNALSWPFPSNWTGVRILKYEVY
ncbi:MAG TPA: hypothetical protein VFI06_02575 [Chitinophagaceae bacterium]|nr:hypothetical protein [Chitinophagaceae bacterium]